MELAQKGIIREEEKEIVFLEDYLSSSPSFAASLLMGRSANGWTEWKMNNGKTLDEMERKSLSSLL